MKKNVAETETLLAASFRRRELREFFLQNEAADIPFAKMKLGKPFFEAVCPESLVKIAKREEIFQLLCNVYAS